jgi:hypothetical protein
MPNDQFDLRIDLRFISQTLLVAVLFHALAALVLGDFRFAAFF